MDSFVREHRTTWCHSERSVSANESPYFPWQITEYTFRMHLRKRMKKLMNVTANHTFLCQSVVVHTVQRPHFWCRIHPPRSCYILFRMSDIGSINPYIFLWLCRPSCTGQCLLTRPWVSLPNWHASAQQFRSTFESERILQTDCSWKCNFERENTPL